MSEEFSSGLQGVIIEIVGGIITTVLLDAIAVSGLIPPSYMLLFHLLNIIFMITLVLSMLRWGFIYIIGWLIGLWIMSTSGLLQPLDFVIYLIPLAVLIIRICKKVAT